MQMIIMDEAKNLALHIRIAEEKEFDFLREAAFLAKKYKYPENAEIEPEKDEKTVEEKEKEISMQEYTGFLHIRCEECGETESYNAKDPVNYHKCKKCGHITVLKDLKPMYANCKKCGSQWKYRTNRNTAELTHECLKCGSLIDMEMNSRRTAYVAKTDRMKKKFTKLI